MGLHQELMNQAYEKWEDTPDWDYWNFVEHLSDLEKKAVLIGNLNYQVENGGFPQWDDNGYSVFSEKIIDILKEFEQSFPEIAKKIIGILEEWETAKENYEECENYYDRHWREEYEEEEDCYYDYTTEIDKLSNKYYEIQEEFLKKYESWLKTLI